MGHRRKLRILICLLIINPNIIPTQAYPDYTLPIIIQTRSSDGSIKVHGEFLSNDTYIRNIYWDYIQILEKNSMLHVVPHDRKGRILSFEFPEMVKIEEQRRPYDVSGSPESIAWTPYVLSNGSLRFYSVINSGEPNAHVKLAFSDSKNNTLGNSYLEPQLESIYSTGGIGGLNKNTNNYFVAFSRNENDGENSSVEILVFNLETSAETHYFVDFKNFIKNLSIYQNQLYGVIIEEQGVKLLRANNGTWETIIVSEESNYVQSLYLTYFFFDGVYFEIRRKSNSQSYNIEINRWNLTNQQLIDSFNHEVNYVDIDRDTDLYRSKNYELLLYYESEFRIRQTDSKLLFDYYYQILSFDFNQNNQWNAHSILPEKDELIINSYPLDNEKRLELVTVFRESWISTNEENKKWYHQYSFPLAILIVILVVFLPYSKLKKMR